MLNVFSTCTGEAVAITGTMHLTQRYDVSDDGDFHFINQTHAEGFKGVGLISGADYAFGHAQEYIFITKSPQTEFTYQERIRTQRLHGGIETGDDFFLQMKNHVTVNANGEVTSEFSDTTFECR